jgi:hypothetical protein
MEITSGVGEPHATVTPAVAALVYKENRKHKPGVFGDGPPRWYPDSDTPCPPDLTTEEAQAMLEESVEGADYAHPDRKARYAMCQGTFFKGYPESIRDDVELWHGYPVREDLVPRQIPARVLREFVRQGKLAKPRYKKLLGSAR